MNLNDLAAPGLGEDVRFTTVEGQHADVRTEEMDAMRGAERPGAGIEDIAQPEDEETRDRAFDSPEGRLITLINAREALGKMTRDELKDLSMSLDADMVAALRHILANPMYAPMEETTELNELRLPQGVAEEYIIGLRALMKKHGRDKVVQAYAKAGGTDKQVAPMRDVKSML